MSIVKTSLTEALFPKTLQRILALLYGNVEKSFYTNEIIRRTGMGSGAIQRELASLINAGIINTKTVGNQKHYQVNKNNPIYSELHSIVLKTFGLADVLTDTLEKVASKISFAFIYGSFAKQQENAKSDIDLLIISNDLSYADVFSLLGKAEIHLGRTIHPTFYSLTEWAQKLIAGNNFVTQVNKQPKIFLIGKEDDFKKFSKNRKTKT